MTQTADPCDKTTFHVYVIQRNSEMDGKQDTELPILL